MKFTFFSLFTLLNLYSAFTQNFQGSITYKCKTNFHLQKEANFKLKNPNKKKGDSINIAINDSTLYHRIKKKGKLVDSIKVILGNKKLKKTYFKKNNLDFIFDFNTLKKITHHPEYQCIDTTDITLVDYKDKTQIIKRDSTYLIDNLECNKYSIILSNYYFLDIYYIDSKYKNLATAFIYEINNNILFQNLYFLKDELQHKKVIKLKYWTEESAMSFEYTLSSVSEKPISENDFVLPKYEYCYWDIFEDKKLMRKYRKKQKLENKNNK